MQSVPKSARYRRCLRAAPGFRMVTADYSGCELRIIAEASGDPVFIDTFRAGGDLHSMVAQSIFKKKVDRNENADLRARAKVINFGLAYGMGAQGLAVQTGLPVREASALLERYFAAFPKIRDYLESSADEAVRRGYAVTLGGRRCKLPSPTDERHLAEIRRFAKNMPVQGTNADMLKVTMALALERFGDAGAGAGVVNIVHDEVVAEVPEGRAREAAGLLKLCMIEAGALYVKKVPVEVECFIGDYWGDKAERV